MLVTRDNFIDCLSKLTSDTLVVDCETTGLKPFRRGASPADQVCGVAVLDGSASFYFPIRHAGGANITSEQYNGLLARIGSAKCVINHNTKFDLQFMHQDGMPMPAVSLDTCCGSVLYNENESHKLKSLADKYIADGSSTQADDLDSFLTMNGLAKNEMWRLPPERVAAYAEQDVWLARALHEWLERKLFDKELYYGLSAFSHELMLMETRGLWINRHKLNELRNEAHLQTYNYLTVLRTMAGFPLNPNSPAQVTKWLGCPDATEETLSSLDHPGAKAIISYKAWRKAIDSYYTSYVEQMDDGDCLHANFNPIGTVTSRITSSDPNLQAVPRMCEEQKVKSMVQAREGYYFAELDYSQAEIRVAAHYTGERAICDLFERDGDLHSEVASAIGVPRQVGKILNLAIAYGAGANVLAGQIKCSKKQAQVFLDKYHKQYPRFKEVARAAERTAENRGWIPMYTGRRRHFNTEGTDPHKAFPNLIQGSVGEMVRNAMIKIGKDIPVDTARMLVQVHDSILFEVKLGEEEIVENIKDIMEHQPWCRVPIKVDVKVGMTWGSMNGKKPAR